MKVYHITSSGGGMHSRMIKEIHTLQKIDCVDEIKIIVWNRNKLNKNILEISKEKKVKLNIINIPSQYGKITLSIVKFWFSLFRKIRKEADENTLLWVHGLISAIPITLLKLSGKKFKFIYDIHDLDFEIIYQNYKNIFGKFLSKFFEKIDLFLVRQVDRILVPTESIGKNCNGLKEFYINKGIKEEKIVTLWNVPEIDKFLNYKKIKLKKPKGFVVGYIGLIREEVYKSILILFETINELGQDYKIVLVGFGTAKEKLKKIAKKKYKNLNIIFYDAVKYNILPNYYNICDAILSIMYGEIKNVKRAIQTKVFESAFLGIPVIVQENTLNADFVRKYNCGVVIKDLTVEEIKIALEKVKKIKFNPEDIRKKWNWKNEEKKLVKIIKELNK